MTSPITQEASVVPLVPLPVEIFGWSLVGKIGGFVLVVI